jgi:hypothetical protein
MFDCRSVELPPGQVPVRCRSGQGQGPVRCRSEGVRNRPDGTLTTRLAARPREHYSAGYIPLTRIDFRARGATRRQPPSAGASPSSTVEGAFLTAIAIAQPQKARSFELRAALALAKLYQATKTASPKPTRCSRPCSTDSRQRPSSPRSSRRADVRLSVCGQSPIATK